ncbi:hypothetical protein, partial [Oleiagrimonas sp.]|uniref:hypothetical protein n=1 Tax=Oleiagrimonas sp. TaxID=2010330 RepID=UPI00260335F8
MNERFRIRSKSLKLDVNANHDCDRTTRRDRGGRTLRPVLVLLATLLCATFAALAWAGNGPASPNINLDVHNHASNGSDGYTNTTASNGATYSYR